MTGRTRRARRAGRGLCQGAGHVPRPPTRPTRSSPTRSSSTSTTCSPRSPARSGRRTGSRSTDAEGRLRQGAWRPSSARRRGRQARPGRGRQLRPRPRRRRHRRDHLLHQHLEPERDDRRRACWPATRSRRACTTKPWVKTSLAPGSQVVAEYLEKAGLQDDLDELGFNLVGFGCTTCIGNSGPLPEPVSKAINDNDLVAGAVLSGNRNFEGRVNPDVRANYLASPPLVVAYALAGSMQVDLAKEPLGTGSDGKPVYLKDIWPSTSEIAGLHRAHHHRRAVQAALCRRLHGRRELEGHPGRDRAHLRVADRLDLRAEPALFRGHDARSRSRSPTSSTRASSASSATRSPPTTSRPPATSGRPRRPASICSSTRFAVGRLQPVRHAARQSRGDDARHLRQHPHQEPDGEGRDRQRRRGRLHHPLAGRASGCRSTTPPCATRRRACRSSSSPARNTAPARRATGRPRARTCSASAPSIAESFERIHRSNLVGMGVVPLVFEGDTSWQSLGLKGDETVTIRGIAGDLKPRQKLDAEITSPDGNGPGGAARLPHRYARRARILPQRRHPALRAAPARGVAPRGSAGCSSGGRTGPNAPKPAARPRLGQGAARVRSPVAALTPVV